MNIQKDISIVARLCIWCGGGLEFQLSETLKEAGINFVCSSCGLHYKITEVPSTLFKPLEQTPPDEQ